MIIDRLGSAIPVVLPPRLQRALAFLTSTNLATLTPGRHDIDGDRLFALVSDYTTRPAADAVWEAHRAFVDVQSVVHGIERLGYLDLAGARERVPYDPARDVAFFHPGSDFVTLTAGMVAILGPGDVHAPGLAAGEPSAVRKIVIKAALAD